MPRYSVEIFTSVYLAVEVDAENRDEAEHAVLNGDALPRFPVVVRPEEGCPSDTQVSIDNKGWEVSESARVSG